MVRGQIELDADVIVIGTGAAGLCAALTAGLGGASVNVFEKMHSRGGMSNFAEAMFAVESKLQKRLKIGLTLDQVYKSHMEKTHWLGDGRMVRTFMEKTADTIDWLENLGVVFTDVKSIYPDGPRVWHFIKDLSAIGLIKPLYERIKNIENVQIFMDTPVTKILREKDKVTGVIAKDKEGQSIHARARAVIVACGGYQNNSEWLAKYCRGGRYITAFIPSKQLGEPIQMAWDIGAAQDGMGVLQSFPFVPGERNLASQLLHAGMQPYLWINKKGERFCDESIVWKFPIACNALAKQLEATAYCIFDETTKNYLQKKGIQYSIGEFLKPSMTLDELDSEIEDGIYEGKAWQASSLEELAEKLCIETKALQYTVDEYNECCNQHRDFIFAKDRTYLHRIEKPKFYAIQLGIFALISEGGIKVNHKMEVKDTEDNVIPGLYAVGCCVSGLVGETYNLDTTGGSISFACNSGRIAGESILEYIKYNNNEVIKEVSNMSKSSHFEAGGPPEEFWKGIQQHMGYSNEEMERLRKSKFAKVLPVMGSPAIQGKTMVVEVVKSHGCAEGMKVGDKLYFTGCSNLDPQRSSRWCAYNMSHITNFANLCHNMLLQGINPNEMYSNHFSCMDCGSELGLGLVISKVTVIDEPKK